MPLGRTRRLHSGPQPLGNRHLSRRRVPRLLGGEKRGAPRDVKKLVSYFNALSSCSEGLLDGLPGIAAHSSLYRPTLKPGSSLTQVAPELELQAVRCRRFPDVGAFFVSACASLAAHIELTTAAHLFSGPIRRSPSSEQTSTRHGVSSTSCRLSKRRTTAVPAAAHG